MKVSESKKQKKLEDNQKKKQRNQIAIPGETISPWQPHKNENITL